MAPWSVRGFSTHPLEARMVARMVQPSETTLEPYHCKVQAAKVSPSRQVRER